MSIVNTYIANSGTKTFAQVYKRQHAAGKDEVVCL